MEAKHTPGSEEFGNDFGKLEPTFASLNMRIIEARCVECHSGRRTPHGIDLSSYEKIMGGNVFPPLVVPGDPMSSSLYRSVLNDSMPKDSDPLSSQEKLALFNWIKNGALKVPDSGGDPCKGGNCEDGEPGDDEPDDEDDHDDHDEDDANECEPDEPCEDQENLEIGEPR